MISMSEAYKRSMAEKLRNRSFMLVTIGVINQAAQSGASVANIQGTEYSYLSNFEKLFDNYDVSVEYTTLEENFFKTDGSMLFPPRKDSGDLIYNVGTVTEEIKGTVAIVFDNIYDIRGLTIDFGEKYPVDFSVSNGSKTVNYTDNTKSYWTTEDIFTETQYLIITPTKMKNGNNRLRIRKILMGVGILFENAKILNATKTEFVSPISEELPTLDFSLKIENRNRAFDVENKTSAINYLEIGQEVNVRYGYDVLGDGNITWMDGCTCNLSDWEADDSTMSFTAKDKLDSLQDTYYGGLYRPDGISLYDLAVDVLTDAGLDEREYELDEYLQGITVINPLPCTSHKECLQLIANAGRCKLYTDRDGRIGIKAAFLTVISPDRMLVQSDSATVWSNLPSVINGAIQYEYATLSQNYFKTDGTMLFLPRTGPYYTAGFVSEETADENGGFTTNPKFKIILEAATTYYGLQINFTSNPPQGITIYTYYEDELKESYVVPGTFGLENTIDHEFPQFDTIEFEFTKGAPNSRVFVKSVAFGDVTDYRMDYDVMTKTPKGKQIEIVQRVDVLQNIYSTGADESTIFQETVDVTGINNYTFYFSSASYDLSVTAGGNAVTIVDSSSYFVTVDVSAFTGELEFIVNGREYTVTNKIRSKTINPTGKIESWDNPLISSAELADLQAEWLGNYFANNIEYDITYRGEPRLDSGDLVFLENQYVDNLQIQLYENSVSFNGALSGTVKARRAVGQNG